MDSKRIHRLVPTGAMLETLQIFGEPYHTLPLRKIAATLKAYFIRTTPSSMCTSVILESFPAIMSLVFVCQYQQANHMSDIHLVCSIPATLTLLPAWCSGSRSSQSCMSHKICILQFLQDCLIHSMELHHESCRNDGKHPPGSTSSLSLSL